MDRILASDIKHGSGIFDGSNINYISTPYGSGLNTANGLTVECWFNSTAASGSSILLSFGQNPDNRIYVGLQSPTNITLGFGNKPWQGGYTITTSTWYHFAASIIDKQATIYINGVFHTVVISDTPITTVSNLSIGKHADSSFPFKGGLDEVRIWTYARTAQQIKDNFNKTIGAQTGLASYYKLDGNALDSSGNNKHGTVNGSVAWSVDGKVNDVSQVAEFNGVDSGINTTLNGNSIGQTFTLMGWIKPTKASTEQQTIVFHENSNQISSYSAMLLMVINNKLTIRLSDHVTTTNSISGLASPNTLILNKWYHVALVCTPTNVDLYENGIKVATTVKSHNIVWNNGAAFSIGRITGTNRDVSLFNGNISNISLTAIARTQQEIQSNMFDVFSATTTGLVEQWTLNGHSLGTKGNNGTLVGGAKFIADIPFIKADISNVLERFKPLTINTTIDKDGVKGSAVFNGSSGSIDTTQILSATSYTKEAWVSISAQSGSNNIISGGQTAFFIPSGNLQAGHNGAWGQVADSQKLVINTWYHVAVTYDSVTQAMILYKNGIVIATGTSVAQTSTSNLFISKYGTGNWFNGKIHDARTWNYVRTGDQIRSTMNMSLPPLPGLILNYKLNGNALDSSGFNKHGILSATGVTWSKDASASLIIQRLLASKSSTQYMLKFASNKGVIIPHSPELEFTGKSFSISFWIKFTNTDNRVVLEKSIDNNNVSLQTLNGGILIRLGVNSSTHPFKTSTAINDNKWHHTVFYYNATTNRTGIIVDAVTNGSEDTRVSGTIANTLPWTIGHRGGSSFSFTGDMKELTFWNKPLTVAESKNIMLNGVKGTEDGIISTYQENIINSNVLQDKLQLNNGIIDGAKVVNSTAPAQLRSGLKLDPTNSYVTVPSLASVSPFGATPHTLEAWVYPLAYTNDYNYIISIGGGTTTAGRQSSIGFRGTGKVFQSAYTSPIVEFNYTLPLRQWTHLSISHSGGVSTLIVNGVTTQQMNIALNVTGTKVNIGAHTTNGSHSNTIISNARIWSAALTDDTVKANMHCYLPANTPNLVEQLPLNEGAGTIIYGTKGNNGTITGTTTWTTPSNMNFVGKCFHNNDGNFNKSIKLSKPFGVLGSHTVEAWVKIPLINTGGLAVDERVGCVLGNFDLSYLYTTRPQTGYELHTSGRVRLWWNNIHDIYGSRDLRDNTWHHVAWVVNMETSEISIFIDGIRDAYGSSRTITPLTFTSVHCIGEDFRPDVSFKNQFHGKIDEVRVWNYARTQAQIQETMNITLGRQPGLILNMGFESDNYDASGYSNHGIFIGSPLLEVNDNPNLLSNAPIYGY
jgi:hypothetical protein